MVVSFSIGPGLIVNSIFKAHAGRARPMQVKEFNGVKLFTPVLKLSTQCQSNCSFPSGHAAMAFAFTNFAYVTAILQKNRNSNKYFTNIYIIAVIFGIFVSLSRIISGSHFLSDALASCFIVCAINHLFYLVTAKLCK